MSIFLSFRISNLQSYPQAKSHQARKTKQKRKKFARLLGIIESLQNNTQSKNERTLPWMIIFRRLTKWTEKLSTFQRNLVQWKTLCDLYTNRQMERLLHRFKHFKNAVLLSKLSESKELRIFLRYDCHRQSWNPKSLTLCSGWQGFLLFGSEPPLTMRAAGRPANASRTLGGQPTSFGPLDHKLSWKLEFGAFLPPSLREVAKIFDFWRRECPVSETVPSQSRLRPWQLPQRGSQDPAKSQFSAFP